MIRSMLQWIIPEIIAIFLSLYLNAGHQWRQWEKMRIFKSWPICSPHRWINKKEKKRGGLGINRGVGFSQSWNRQARLLTAGREISPRSSLFFGKTEKATEIELRNRLSPNFKILTFQQRWIANTLYVKMSVTHCKRIKKISCQRVRFSLSVGKGLTVTRKWTNVVEPAIPRSPKCHKEANDANSPL